METVVADLAANSGALQSVSGVAATAGRYRSLEFEYASGVLSLRCDDDTDEIIVEVARKDPAAVPVADAWVRDLLGKWIEYAWDLRNHRGYNDGFQLRPMNSEREQVSRQFEVAGSGIDVRLVDPATA